MEILVNFVLWILVFAGIGAVCYLFYRWRYRLEQRKYEGPRLRTLHASDFWPR